MENIAGKRKRARTIFETLDPLYTRKHTALRYETPLDLLIATILSAQCTDRQVNRVTRTLFENYRTPRDYLAVPVSRLEQDIRSTGFYRNKARSITGTCRMLLESFGGSVPSTMEELLRLPGVGRKTANCVLGAVFGVPGVVVDTHVKRLALRLALTEHQDPDKIERDLEEVLPRDRWRRFSDLLINHGRAICPARKPDHARCQISKWCPSRTL